MHFLAFFSFLPWASSEQHGTASVVSGCECYCGTGWPESGGPLNRSWYASGVVFPLPRFVTAAVKTRKLCLLSSASNGENMI